MLFQCGLLDHFCLSSEINLDLVKLSEEGHADDSSAQTFTRNVRPTFIH